MKRLLALIYLVLSPPASGGPLPITVVDGFRFRGWEVNCSNITSFTPVCSAIRKVRGRCVYLVFRHDRGRIDLLRNCGEALANVDSFRTEEFPLPRSDWDNDIGERISLLFHDDLAARARPALDEAFLDDAEYLAELMYKITNG